jgi:hypothetical protein
MIEAVSLVDLTIRDARLNDAAELAALTCELGYKTTSVEMATRLETVLKDALQNICRGDRRKSLRNDRHGFALQLSAE